jgi:uncharacterized protein YqjF (DUF2071 family)
VPSPTHPLPIPDTGNSSGGFPAIEPVTAEPIPLPRRAVLRQRWSELAYFHWRYEPQVVQRLLPDGVRVDTFDGSAWVGLIPFEMRNVQLGPTPPVPWLGDFIEINVRTYVIDTLGRRSVWFFSLDVPRMAIVGVARTVFSLPYCWACAEHVVERNADRGEQHRYRMTRRWPRGAAPHADRGEHHRYRMTRRWPRGAAPHADMSFRVGDALPEHAVGDLEHFLSARWALVTDRRGTLLYGRVEHPRWPLHHVDGVEIDQNVLQEAGLPAPGGTPHAMYSPGVDVSVAWFEPIPGGASVAPNLQENR